MVIKFPAPKRASYLQASATVEASAFIFLLPQQFAGTCRDAGFAALLPRDVFAEVARAARGLLLRRARMRSLHRRRFSSALALDSNLAEGFFVALIAALRCFRSAIALSVSMSEADGYRDPSCSSAETDQRREADRWPTPLPTAIEGT